MRTRYVLMMTFGFKIGILLFCLSLLYVNRLMGESYFSTVMPEEEQRQSVSSAVDRDQRNEEGLTGLMFAAVYGEVELAKILFEYGADLNLRSAKEQQTALHYATNNMRAVNSQNVGYFLVDVYANTMLKNVFGQIPLHLVISTDALDDRTKMVDVLVKNGSNINEQTYQGDTLMHLAVNLKNVGWVQTLLERWSSLIDLSIKNKQGLTPYQYAQQLGYGFLTEVLAATYPKVQSAGDYDKNGLSGLMLAIIRNDQKEIAVAVKKPKIIHLLSEDGYRNSALHIALIYQNLPAITALIENGASCMLRNAKLEVPAHYLVRVSDVQKKLKVVPLIMNKSPRSILAQNDRGNTLLHYIVQYNDVPLLDYLINKHRPLVKEALDIKNKALQSPIRLAADLNRAKMSEKLSVIARSKN